LTYKEVDFSECNLTNDTLKVVLDICGRCAKLRILKLYRNNLDDKSAERLAEMLRKCPELEELHLSHNFFTADGVKRLVAAGESFSWEDKTQPLWLRLEQNSVVDPETICKDLEEEFSVCRRSDDKNCTVRMCVNKMKVHLPFFHLQRQSFKSREQQAAEAKAKQAPPVPTRSMSRPEAGAPKQAAAKPCAWGKGRVADGSPKSGYPALGAKDPQASPKATAQVEPTKAELLLQPLWKAGGRPSVVLDSFGQRRTMPEQLEGVDPKDFVCALCRFVMIKPVITRCSHIFCSCCFRQWVQRQVDLQKNQNQNSGPPVTVPQIRCPHGGCDQLLKKTDVESADDGKTSGVQLFQRLRNNLSIRCVHHPDHQKFEFGKDASRVLSEQGISCRWSGPPTAYEEHMSHQCAVENFLKLESSEQGADAIISNDNSTSQYEAEPEPEDSVSAEPKVAQADGTVTVNKDECEVRVALYPYTPTDGDEAQIKIEKNDLIKVFQVTETGWAAGVRICPKTRQEQGSAGWFPVGYLQPAQGAHE